MAPKVGIILAGVERAWEQEQAVGGESTKVLRDSSYRDGMCPGLAATHAECRPLPPYLEPWP